MTNVKANRAEKSDAFLWAVQTGLLRQAADVLVEDATNGFGQAHRYSGTGLFIQMDEAVRAAGLIPAEKDASDAAKEFVAFWNRDEAAPRPDPGWFARYGEEAHDYGAIDKASQFLWIVQTVILAEAANQQARDGKARGPGVATAAAEMVRAAKLIPTELSSTEAANQFTAFSIPGGMKELRACPKWYVRRLIRRSRTTDDGHVGL